MEAYNATALFLSLPQFKNWKREGLRFSQTKDRIGYCKPSSNLDISEKGK
jgi:hypothetical protein